MLNIELNEESILSDFLKESDELQKKHDAKDADIQNQITDLCRIYERLGEMDKKKNNTEAVLKDIGLEYLLFQEETENNDLVINIKQERDVMPAPSFIPPLKKIKTEKSSKRTKAKKTSLEGNKKKDSDVEAISPRISTIDLENDEKCKKSSVSNAQKSKAVNGTLENVENLKNTRSTRSKTVIKAVESEDYRKLQATGAVPKGVYEASKKNEEEKENVDPPIRQTRTRTLKKAKAAPSTNDIQENDGKEAAENEEATEKAESPPIRQTRTRTIKKAKNTPSVDTQQDDEKDTAEDAPVNITRNNTFRVNQTTEATFILNEEDKKIETNVEKAEELNSSRNSVYEDAKDSAEIPEIQPSSSNATLDKTVVISKSSKVPKNISKIPKKAETVHPLLTDDESSPEQSLSPKVSKNPIKPIFSPYCKNTTKTKVEAFEKLTKKMNTPTATLYPSATSTIKKSSKIYTPLGKYNASFSATELPKKPSDKLTSAMKKKEALLNQQKENRRKINEEKQLKAQQQRQLAEEEDKLKKLKIQKEKELKIKEFNTNREESQLKRKLETEQKERAHKQRYNEIKEAAKPPKEIPIYLRVSAPRLPTTDCYDSDEEVDPTSYKASKIGWWNMKDDLIAKQVTMLAAGEKIKNSLFSCNAASPSLEELFEVKSSRKLKRNSSAIWKTVPRYTMLSILDETHEFSEDDEQFE